MLDIIQVFQGWRMVEDRWRFIDNLNSHKYISISIIQRNSPCRVEGGGIKQQKILGETTVFAVTLKYINIFTFYLKVSYILLWYADHHGHAAASHRAAVPRFGLLRCEQL